MFPVSQFQSESNGKKTKKSDPNNISIQQCHYAPSPQQNLLIQSGKDSPHFIPDTFLGQLVQTLLFQNERAAKKNKLRK